MHKAKRLGTVETGHQRSEGHPTGGMDQLSHRVFEMSSRRDGGRQGR
jgi:hypothetical protein